MKMITKIIQDLQKNNTITNPSFDDLRKAWEECQNSQKLLGIAKLVKIDKETMVKIACECARLVLHLVPEREDRPRLAIEAAELWIKNPSKENAANAADVAKAAYAANATYSAAYFAAYFAAYAANSAANATNAATYAAYSAAHAAYAAANADDATDIKSKLANIVREYIPFEMLKLSIIFL